MAALSRAEYQLARQLLRPLTIIRTSQPLRCPPLKVRAVILDVYGTLLSSAAGDVGTAAGSAQDEAFAQALKDGGWYQGSDLPAAGRAGLLTEAIRASRQLRQEQGEPYPEVEIRSIWQAVLAELGVALDRPWQEDREIEQGLRLTALSYECRTNPVWPMAGLIPTLEALSSAGLILGILSNAQFYTPLLLEMFLGRSLEEMGFAPQLLLWSHRHGLGKPAPWLFAEMNRRLALLQQISPQQVLYLGNDMRKDMIPANQAGWHGCLFAGDQRSLRLYPGDQKLGSARPELVINELNQLVQILR
ncbi:HAD family hydrolase [Desulfogranum mediterraneum]|uniref:HAD family hydrolase n=1 Tax=Desulfogranum mediterraneum TaxID=160661 RepID=UPI0004160376|nr:HAD family hydrolase [Desulfogranum mediterraneum]